MKRFSLADLKLRFSKSWQSLRGQRLFRDRLSISLVLASLALNAITWVVLLSKVRPTDFPVPIRYSSLSGFDVLGPWYQTFRLGIFALAASLVNLGLAVRSFTRSRISSFFLLSSNFVVSLFCLIISIAFTTTL